MRSKKQGKIKMSHWNFKHAGCQMKKYKRKNPINNTLTTKNSNKQTSSNNQNSYNPNLLRILIFKMKITTLMPLLSMSQTYNLVSQDRIAF